MENPFEKIFPKPPKPTSLHELRTLDYDKLRIEFIRLSPSYRLAQEISGNNVRTRKKTELVAAHYLSNEAVLSRLGFLKPGNQLKRTRFEKLLPEFFEGFIQTYKKFGSISNTYEDWLKTINAFEVFDHPFNIQLPIDLVITKITPSNKVDVQKKLSSFVDEVIARESHSGSLVLQIPLHLPVELVTTIVKNLHLDNQDEKTAYIAQASIKNPLYGNISKKRLQQRQAPLTAKLRVLIAKSLCPDEPLWKIGLLADISPVYSRITKNGTMQNKLSQEDKTRLSIITSRALTHAQFISENAAHGEFPTSMKIPLPKYEPITQQQIARQAWPTIEIQ